MAVAKRRRPDFGQLRRFSREADKHPPPDSVIVGDAPEEPRQPLDFLEAQRRVRLQVGYNKRRKHPIALAGRFSLRTHDSDGEAVTFVPLQCGAWATLQTPDAFHALLWLGHRWGLRQTKGGPVVLVYRYQLGQLLHCKAVGRALLGAAAGECVAVADGDPFNLRRRNLYFSRETEEGRQLRDQWQDGKRLPPYLLRRFFLAISR